MSVGVELLWSNSSCSFPHKAYSFVHNKYFTFVADFSRENKISSIWYCQEHLKWNREMTPPYFLKARHRVDLTEFFLFFFTIWLNWAYRVIAFMTSSLYSVYISSWMYMHIYAVMISAYLTVSNFWLAHTRILWMTSCFCALSVWKQKNTNVTPRLERWQLRTCRMTCWSSWQLKQKLPVSPNPRGRDILKRILPGADYIVLQAVQPIYHPPTAPTYPFLLFSQ